MAGFKIDRFNGAAPKVDPRLLSNTAAQTAQNADLVSGKLEAWKGLTSESCAVSSTTASIHLFDSGTKWLESVRDVNYVKGPIAGDTYERTYYTNEMYGSDNSPRMTYTTINSGSGCDDFPKNSYLLGLPAPASSPTLNVTGTSTGNDDDRVYVYTYVTALGEEGPPCTASAIATVGDGQTCTLSGLSTGPSGAYNVTHKRIYRAASNSAGVADYLYLTQVAVATTSYADSASTSALGETLPSANWVAPPSSTYATGPLLGLTMMANGVMAGFTGKELCFSEPNMPHAWPESYRLTMEYDIVAIGAAGASLIVATEANPYIVTGVDPLSMTAVKLDLNQACVSKRSLVDMGESIIFASPDGLVSISPSGGALITREIIDREYWQSLSPENIHGYYVEGKYLGFYNTTGSGFVFDPKTGDFTTVSAGANVTAGHNDLETDTLYLAAGGDIKKWNLNASRLSYTWKTKVLETVKPLSFGVLEVMGEQSASSPITAKVYRDGSLIHTVSLTSSDPVRLPSGTLSKEWEVQVEGSAKLESIIIAETMTDLAKT